MPGEAVSVAFRGQTARTVTDPLGRWEVWLQPLSAGPAAAMTIQGLNTITIADVLVGDVWIGSGQSNMQWAVRQSDNAEAEIAVSHLPADPAVLCPPENIRRAPWRTSTPDG